MRMPLLACLLVVAGCATTARRENVLPASVLPAVPPTAVLFVANGSGDPRTLTTNVSELVAEKRLPLQIETVTWSHGPGRNIADHVDRANQLTEGRRLACQVLAYRQAYPDRQVYLLGHSTGCAVVLAATEQLPPGSIDRLILLSPSVCRSYDLRPALRGARGIDVFYSGEDRWVLGVGMFILGTSDRECRTAAGQYGFTPVVECPGDAELYVSLGQHPWDASAQWSGNDGGHWGNNQVDFLRAYVLPLLVPG